MGFTAFSALLRKSAGGGGATRTFLTMGGPAAAASYSGESEKQSSFTVSFSNESPGA